MLSSGGEVKVSDGGVNYESTPLVELELDGIQYRIDAGKQGTALCISTRDAGTWAWSFGGEARWDGSMLRAKAFERPVLTSLATALRAALENGD
ncbi:MAG TPA: hypothetical protein VFZ53_30265 [Polyangiaceae bacterium]